MKSVFILLFSLFALSACGNGKAEQLQRRAFVFDPEAARQEPARCIG